MSSILGNLKVFLNYDLDLSAKKSKKILAVLNQKNYNKVNDKYLTVIDWKTISLLKKFLLIIRGNISKKSINKYVGKNISGWSALIGDDSTMRVKFEKQCAKLNRKIKIADSPIWQWNLNITFEYLDLENKEKKLSKSIKFSRLANYDTLNQIISSTKDRMTKYEKKVSLNLYKIFKDKTYSPANFTWNQTGQFLEDHEKGEDRSCTIHLFNLNDDAAMIDLIEQCETRAYNRGYDTGYDAGHSKGMSDGAHLASLYK